MCSRIVQRANDRKEGNLHKDFCVHKTGPRTDITTRNEQTMRHTRDHSRSSLYASHKWNQDAEVSSSEWRACVSRFSFFIETRQFHIVHDIRCNKRTFCLKNIFEKWIEIPCLTAIILSIKSHHSQKHVNGFHHIYVSRFFLFTTQSNFSPFTTLRHSHG